MSTYSEDVLVNKLSRLVDTQESVALLSQWLMYHRKHVATSVQVWAREIHKAPAHRKLSFLYLCNDVVQISRKKGDEFVREFARVLPEVIPHLYRHLPSDLTGKVTRILTIWQERSVYSEEFLIGIRRKTGSGGTGVVDAGKKIGASQTGQVPLEVKQLVTIVETLDSIEPQRIGLDERAGALTSSSPDDVSNAIATLQQLQDFLDRESEERKRLLAELHRITKRQELLLEGTKVRRQEVMHKMRALSSSSSSSGGVSNGASSALNQILAGLDGTVVGAIDATTAVVSATTVSEEAGVVDDEDEDGYYPGDGSGGVGAGSAGVAGLGAMMMGPGGGFMGWSESDAVDLSAGAGLVGGGTGADQDAATAGLAQLLENISNSGQYPLHAHH